MVPFLRSNHIWYWQDLNLAIWMSSAIGVCVKFKLVIFNCQMVKLNSLPKHPFFSIQYGIRPIKQNAGNKICTRYMYVTTNWPRCNDSKLTSEAPEFSICKLARFSYTVCWVRHVKCHLLYLCSCNSWCVLDFITIFIYACTWTIYALP